MNESKLFAGGVYFIEHDLQSSDHLMVLVDRQTAAGVMASLSSFLASGKQEIILSFSGCLARRADNGNFIPMKLVRSFIREHPTCERCGKPMGHHMVDIMISDTGAEYVVNGWKCDCGEQIVEGVISRKRGREEERKRGREQGNEVDP